MRFAAHVPHLECHFWVESVCAEDGAVGIGMEHFRTGTWIRKKANASDEVHEQGRECVLAEIRTFAPGDDFGKQPHSGQIWTVVLATYIHSLSS